MKLVFESYLLYLVTRIYKGTLNLVPNLFGTFMFTYF